MRRIIVGAGLFAFACGASPGQSPSAAPTPNATPVLKDGTGAVLFLRFSPDGRELARTCQFGPVLLYDTSGYRKARTFPVGMWSVAYSPDGTKIATAEGRDGARVWDAAAAGKPRPNSMLDTHLLDAPLRVLQTPSQDSKLLVFSTEFSPDGKHLITTQANGHVKIWNTGSWTVEDDLLLTDTEVRAAAFSPDGKIVMIGDLYGGLHEWSFEAKAEIKSMPGPNHGGPITGLMFSPDGKMLVTIHQGATANSTVMLWDTKGWVAQIEAGFSSAAFSKDGKLLALGGNNIELVDPSTRKQIRTIELPQLTGREASRIFENQPAADTKLPVRIWALAFSPDGRTLAAGGVDTSIRLVPMPPQEAVTAVRPPALPQAPVLIPTPRKSSASIRPASFPEDPFFARFLAAGACERAISAVAPTNTAARTAINISGNIVTVLRVSLCGLIRLAYDVPDYRISGLPASMTVPDQSSFYDIQAVAEGQGTPTGERIQAMFQALLADRFRLKLHREMKEFSVYALVVGENGPKLSTGTLPCAKPRPDPDLQFAVCMPNQATGSMDRLAEDLSKRTGRPVLDKTGLTGKYTFEVRYTRKGAPIKPDIPSSIFAAVEQLGLRLDPQQASVETLVIDQAKAPAEN